MGEPASIYDVRATFRKSRLDFSHFAANYLKIEPEQGGTLIPFQLNRTQQICDYVSRVCPRIIKLKGRGMGITTLGLGHGVHGVWGRPFHHAALLAQTDTDTSKIFRKAVIMKKEMPRAVSLHEPSTNSREIQFDDHESWFAIATAGSRAPMSGSRLQFVWFTEAAKYAGDLDAQQQMFASIAGASQRAVMRMESTAYGVGNMFHRVWSDAERWALDNGYEGLITGHVTQQLVERLHQDPTVRRGRQWVPLFLPWWWDERKRIPLTRSERKDFALTADEQTWAVGLDPEQVIWYREEQRQLSAGELWRQEYPRHPQEAFITSGLVYFDIPMMNRLAANLPKPIRKLDSGYTWIWEEPQDGARYVIGVDPSEGTIDGDYGYVSVFRVGRNLQVARHHSKLDPDALAEVVDRLGRMYHTAEVMAENNLPAFVRAMMKLGYPALMRDENDLTEKLKSLPGVHTSGGNRPLLLNDIRAAVQGTATEQGFVRILDPVFYKETTTFKRKPNKAKYEHESGEHDDVIFGCAFGVRALLLYGDGGAGVHF